MTCLSILDDDSVQLRMLELACQRQRPQWTINAMQIDAVSVDNLPEADCLLVDYGVIADLSHTAIAACCACTPMVIISGSLGRIDIAAMTEAGVAATLAKPRSLDDADAIMAACEAAMNDGEYTNV